MVLRGVESCLLYGFVFLLSSSIVSFGDVSTLLSRTGMTSGPYVLEHKETWADTAHRFCACDELKLLCYASVGCRFHPNGPSRTPQVPGFQDLARQCCSRGACSPEREGDRGRVSQGTVHERHGACIRSPRESCFIRSVDGSAHVRTGEHVICPQSNCCK